MDALKRQAYFAAVAQLLQTMNSNALVIATAILNDDDLVWPQKPYKRFGPIRKLINVQKLEEEGGLSNYYFKFFTRFSKDKIRELA